MNNNHIFKRCFLCLVGLFILAAGIVCCLKSSLGTSPISALPYILSRRFFLRMGAFTFIMHLIYLTVQILILRREFNPVQFLQLPLGIAFGLFNDVALNALSFLQPSSFFMQVVCCLFGCFLMGLGISVLVNAKVIMTAADAMIGVIADCSAVILSITLSYLFFGEFFCGIGISTIVSAFMVGNFVKLCDIVIKPATQHFVGLDYFQNHIQPSVQH